MRNRAALFGVSATAPPIDADAVATAREIERCRLLTIAAVWRLIGGRRAPLNAPSEWNGWHVFNPDDERRRYAARGAAGLCVRCGECPPRPGRKTCQRCADDQVLRARAFRERRRRAGRCTECGEPSGGAARCPVCRRSYRPGGRWARS